MSTRKYAKDGNSTFDDDILQLLAAASWNAYDNLEGGTSRNKRYMGKALDLLLHGGHDDIGWSLLKIQYHGKYADKYIFAIRGTDPENPVNNLISDWSMYMGKMDIIKRDIAQVEKWYQQILDTGVTPDYVTGHSLGGTVAEVMAAKYGIDGASFAAPGPYSENDDYNLLKGSEFRKNITKSRFLAIVNPNDFVPNPSRDNVGALASCIKSAVIGVVNPKQFVKTYKELTSMTSPEDTHIVKDRSVTEPFGKIKDLSCHRISEYVKAVGELKQKKIDKYHANLAEAQSAEKQNKKATKDGKKKSSSNKEDIGTSKEVKGESSSGKKKKELDQGETESTKSKKKDKDKDKKGSATTSTSKEGEKQKSKDASTKSAKSKNKNKSTTSKEERR